MNTESFNSFYKKHNIKILNIFILSFIIIISILYFFLTKHYTPGTPTSLTDGYHGWWDQQQYYQIAEDLRSGQILKEHYVYPLGFPLLGVIFLDINKIDPFIYSGVFLWVSSCLLIYFTIRNYTSNIILSLLGAFLWVFGTSITQYFVLYWTTNIGVLSVLIISYICSLKKVKTKSSVIVGLVIGYFFFTRTVDFVLLIPLIFEYLKIKWKSRRTYFLNLFLMGICVLLFIFLQGYLDYIVFGDILVSPYSTTGAAHVNWFVPQLFFENWKGILFGTGIFDENRFFPPLIRTDILLVIGFLFITFCMSTYRKFMKEYFFYHSVIILFILFYGSYLYFSAEGVKYYSMRFITPIFPIIIILSIRIFSNLSQKNENK